MFFCSIWLISTDLQEEDKGPLLHAHVSPGGQSGVPQGSSPLPLSPRSTNCGLGPCPVAVRQVKEEHWGLRVHGVADFGSGPEAFRRRPAGGRPSGTVPAQVQSPRRYSPRRTFSGCHCTCGDCTCAGTVPVRGLNPVKPVHVRNCRRHVMSPTWVQWFPGTVPAEKK